MDRFCWVSANEHFFGENVIAQQSDVRLYNGDDRVSNLSVLKVSCKLFGLIRLDDV